MGHPLRIQRQRKKGWKMPDDAVYVGRPSNWGNPFSTAAEFRTLLEAIIGVSGQSEFHKTELASFSRVYWMAQHVESLRGKKLACWCGLDHECHADVLAEFANRKQGLIMTTTTTTRYRPINLSAWEVRAILDGRKTQTRRVVKPQPLFDDLKPYWIAASTDRKTVGKWKWGRKDSIGSIVTVGDLFRCPFGQPGDHLFGRECFATALDNPVMEHGQVVYRATDPDWDQCDGFRWRPSTQMPRWASRIDLLIKSIRIERLQEISGPDCWAEGIESAGWDCTKWGSVTHCYRDLWEQANGPESWDANQFVWVIEHERVK